MTTRLVSQRLHHGHRAPRAAVSRPCRFLCAPRGLRVDTAATPNPVDGTNSCTVVRNTAVAQEERGLEGGPLKCGRKMQLNLFTAGQARVPPEDRLLEARMPLCIINGQVEYKHSHPAVFVVTHQHAPSLGAILLLKGTCLSDHSLAIHFSHAAVFLAYPTLELTHQPHPNLRGPCLPCLSPVQVQFNMLTSPG